MQAKDVMTVNPECVTPDEPLRVAALRMRERDVGALPVVDSYSAPKLRGIVTDRDLVCRGLANDLDNDRTVGGVMTSPVASVVGETPLESCTAQMAAQQVRRLVVVDEQAIVIGIIASADIARAAGDEEAGQLLKAVTVASVTGLA